MLSCNGSDDFFGMWLPETHNPRFDHPILEIGSIFEPGNMAVLGTSFVPFLHAWTAYYSLLLEAGSAALDAINLPASLRPQGKEPDDEDFAELRKWADPGLPSYYPDSYRERYDAKRLAKLFGSSPPEQADSHQ